MLSTLVTTTASSGGMMLPVAALIASFALLIVKGIVNSRGNKRKRIVSGKSDLNEFMIEALQPLLDRYTPTWWTNSHIQCILTFLVPQSFVKYKRDILILKDGGQASLDWALESSVKMKSPLQNDSPIAIIMHGLVGCSESMRSLCAEALIHGYRPVVFNKRGHGGLKLATPKLQAFGCVQDLEEAIAYVEKLYPKSELYGIGSSAGSGLLCSYLCELGNKSHLRAGVLISPGYNAFDLFCGGKINPVYDFLMTLTLKSFLLRHKNELNEVVNVTEALKAKSIREFDEHVYMKMHGYQDLEAYWKVNNPMRDVDNLKMPFLCINALDDPVCTKETIPYDEFRKKSNAMLLETPQGSHCAFFEGTVQLKSWCNEVAMTYLDRLREFQATADIVNHERPSSALTSQ
ncbi:serine protease family [Plasmopara halstedii]|uniref:Serine protease family n=1 Tax=Plasmopara halstedii TaxID=4781 RepID=A0A0P1AXE3_PLAHL|nr:serine protease family [Plasmopara halstedii]CEG45457.1 serine protease family [Plasmopara halstedii]|eukprot:XP_024581826.1 serine protease family [Plasmopara halstedii]